MFSVALLASEPDLRALAWAHPLVQEWFVRKFGPLTKPQELGWPHILAGRTTLISAPTGSGKTLAAFLACVDRLVCKALAGDLRDRTEVLYVSPFKALSNDIQKNLEGPLGEILQMAGERGLLMPEIRTAVRTGDTLMKDRRLMLKRPPHMLVTTPESFYILLTAEKSRAILRDVETVIVDEIHAVADDKRGVHLSLSLERLEALTYRHRKMHSTLVVGDRVNLIDDHRLDIAQDGATLLRRQQNVKRLRRSNQDVRRPLQHGQPVFRQRVASTDCRTNLRHQQAARARHLENVSQRNFQVFLDVVAQRFQR